MVMKKLIGIFVVIVALVSCTKEIELNFPDMERPLVVNCLFSEDQPWRVYLTRAKQHNELQDEFVSNATIRITANGMVPVELSYTGHGTYFSEQHPLAGTVYQLQVDVPGHETITASSSIPQKIDVSGFEYENQQMTYFFSNTLEDFDVAPLKLDLKTDAPAFTRFRFYSFNTKNGYLRYRLTQPTIEALRNEGVPECSLAELEKITGQVFTAEKFIRILREIMETCNYHLLEPKVIELVTPFSVATREPEAFDIGAIFSTTNYLHNISIDFRTILGELHGDNTIDLFVDYLPASNKGNASDHAIEYWLEVTNMDEDYYNYQKTYILQAFQAANPYTEPVQVHSNIQNGVGIFAGYHRQMIHFYTY